MTKKSNYLLSLFGALLLSSPIQAQNLLPKPQQVTMGKGVFKTSDGVKVENQVGADAENIYTKAWNAKVNDAAKRVVKFTKLANASSPEAYKLHVAPYYQEGHRMLRHRGCTCLQVAWLDARCFPSLFPYLLPQEAD